MTNKLYKVFKFILLATLVNLSTQVYSSVWIAKKLQIKTSVLTFEIPKSWQYVEGFQGRDVTVLAPKDKGVRDVIIIEQADNDKFSLKEEAKALNKYKQIKSTWIKNKGGTLSKITLGEKISVLKNDHLYNETTYVVSKKNYLEGDLFIKCSDDSFVNLSFLTLKEKEIEFKKIWLRVLKSIRC